VRRSPLAPSFWPYICFHSLSLSPPLPLSPSLAWPVPRPPFDLNAARAPLHYTSLWRAAPAINSFAFFAATLSVDKKGGSFCPPPFLCSPFARRPHLCRGFTPCVCFVRCGVCVGGGLQAHCPLSIRPLSPPKRLKTPRERPRRPTKKKRLCPHNTRCDTTPACFNTSTTRHAPLYKRALGRCRKNPHSIAVESAPPMTAPTTLPHPSYLTRGTARHARGG
jgi:hypothetical protein